MPDPTITTDQVRGIERLALQQMDMIHAILGPQDPDPYKAHRDAEWVGYGEALGVRLGCVWPWPCCAAATPTSSGARRRRPGAAGTDG